MLTTERETYPNGSTYYSVWMYTECLGVFDAIEGGYKVDYTVYETPADAIFAITERFIRRTKQQISHLERILTQIRKERKIIKKGRKG